MIINACNDGPMSGINAPGRGTLTDRFPGPPREEFPEYHGFLLNDTLWVSEGRWHFGFDHRRKGNRLERCERRRILMINQVVIPFCSLDIIFHSIEQELKGRDKRADD